MFAGATHRNVTDGEAIQRFVSKGMGAPTGKAITW
jgi:hypothetical protein